jgi:SnoaL-like domain
VAAQEHAQLARTIYEAFNTNDFDRVLSLSRADVEVVTMAFGMTQHGHDGFRQFMQGWKGMAPDSRVEVVSQLAGAEGVTNECRFRGTHNRPATLAQRRDPPPRVGSPVWQDEQDRRSFFLVRMPYFLGGAAHWSKTR